MTQSNYRAAGMGLLAIGLCLAMSGAAFAQTDSSTETRIAIVKGHNVYVRSGAAESYYPFGKLNDGDFVKVTGSKFEWSRVAPIGPAFDSTFGFVKYAKNETSRFRLAADGNSGVTLGKIDIVAPNLESKYNPKESWKSLVRLEADQTLRVLEKTETDKDIILRVELPDTAFGWVSTAFLETATPEQSSQWTGMLADYTRARAERAKAVASSTAVVTNAPAKPSKPAVAESLVTSSSEPTAPISLPEPAFIAVENESTPLEATAVVANAPAAVPTPNAPEPNRPPTWEDLESALKKLQREPIETAEVTPLRDMYLDLAERPGTNDRVMRYANGRAEQLLVWSDLQKKRLELEAIRQRSKMSADEAIAIQRALESSAEYVAVGRVAASTIYDGTNLPKLLRLQDAASGRTVAYLQPDEDFEIVNLIGNLVGIVGDKQYDGSLRLNIVHAKRIDLLMPEQRQAGVPTDREP